MQQAPTLSVADRLEVAAMRAIAALPLTAKRRRGGGPSRRDGLELDLDMQVVTRLEKLNPRPELASRTPEQAREDLARAVRVVAGAPPRLASVQDVTVAGAEGPLRARL